MQYEKVYSFLIVKLENDLPSILTYHNAQHTKDVVAVAEYLAEVQGVVNDDLILLKTAALLHDSGFLDNTTPQNHEERSCDNAQKYLPDFGYNTQQISTICDLIMATQLPQKPTNQLAQILCDADLYYLGSDNYEVNADRLFREFKDLGIIKNQAEWTQRQINFLTTHRYFTQKAIDQQEPTKQQHLERILSASGPNKWHKYQQEIQDFLMMLVGVIIAGVALKGFLVPNRFFDGGITGFSLLLHELYHLNLGIVIVLLNLPLIIISYFTVGQRFALRTSVSVLMLGIVLLLIPEFALTNDKLLISIFGGVFLGIGVGLNMRVGAALDGIEVLALYTLKRTSFTITEIILGINILIFTIAAFSFGIETALYSILTYFAATRSIDYVVEGLQAFTGVTIISGQSEVIKYQLVNSLGRGITVYKGERGFLPGSFDVSADCDIIFTIITRLELRKLKNLVYEIDPNAFVFANTIKEASGGIIKRRKHH